MSTIKKILSEALGETVVESTCPDCHEDPCVCEEVKEDADIARLRQLSGLEGAGPVSEAGGGLGLAYQRVLDQEYARCETQIMIAVGKIKQYAAKVNSMSDDMSDDEQAHYMYSIRGLLDIMEEELKDLQKLG